MRLKFTPYKLPSALKKPHMSKRRGHCGLLPPAFVRGIFLSITPYSSGLWAIMSREFCFFTTAEGCICLLKPTEPHHLQRTQPQSWGHPAWPLTPGTYLENRTWWSPSKYPRDMVDCPFQFHKAHVDWWVKLTHSLQPPRRWTSAVERFHRKHQSQSAPTLKDYLWMWSPCSWNTPSQPLFPWAPCPMTLLPHWILCLWDWEGLQSTSSTDLQHSELRSASPPPCLTQCRWYAASPS